MKKRACVAGWKTGASRMRAGSVASAWTCHACAQYAISRSKSQPTFGQATCVPRCAASGHVSQRRRGIQRERAQEARDEERATSRPAVGIGHSSAKLRDAAAPGQERPDAELKPPFSIGYADARSTVYPRKGGS